MEEKTPVVEETPSRLIIIYELVFGSFEAISGFGILFFGQKLLGIYTGLRTSELIQDPDDLTVRLAEKILPNLFTHRIYIALLLILFGAVKLTSGVGLIYKKAWAEHLLVIFLVVLIPFEAGVIIRHFSIMDVIYLMIDIVIVLYLIKLKPREYFSRLAKDIRS